jgi:hypothetical protein
VSLGQINASPEISHPPKRPGPNVGLKLRLLAATLLPKHTMHVRCCLGAQRRRTAPGTAMAGWALCVRRPRRARGPAYNCGDLRGCLHWQRDACKHPHSTPSHTMWLPLAAAAPLQQQPQCSCVALFQLCPPFLAPPVVSRRGGTKWRVRKTQDGVMAMAGWRVGQTPVRTPPPPSLRRPSKPACCHQTMYFVSGGV